jgi:hypothetical protein
MNEPAAGPAPPALSRHLGKLLRPLIRLLIRNGITFPVLADLLRDLYVDVVLRDVLTDESARTDSRVSLLTGIHRKEIRRQRTAAATAEPVPETVTLSGQIISRWLGQQPWVDAAGTPRPLPRTADPGEPSFDALVGAVTKDLRPRAVLDEWLRQETVRLDAQDRVVLNVAAFIPQPGREEQLFYFGRNLHDHIAAAAANISAAGKAPFMDRSVHYDSVPYEAAAILEAAGREAGMRLLVEINRRALDLIEAPGASVAPGTPTRRVNLGVYLYIEDEPASGDRT